MKPLTQQANSLTISMPVTPHTIRHSYAMHMLYAGIPLKVNGSVPADVCPRNAEGYSLELRPVERPRLGQPICPASKYGKQFDPSLA